MMDVLDLAPVYPLAIASYLYPAIVARLTSEAVETDNAGTVVITPELIIGSPNVSAARGGLDAKIGILKASLYTENVVPLIDVHANDSAAA